MSREINFKDYKRVSTVKTFLLKTLAIFVLAGIAYFAFNTKCL